MQSENTKGKKLLIFTAEDKLFCQYRFPIACAARDAGFEVLAVAGHTDDKYRKQIESLGVRFIPLNLSRHNKNPLLELRAIWQLAKVFLREQPDISHHVALKPIVYGAIAGFFASLPCVVDAVTGLGSIFSSKSRKLNLIRPMMNVFLTRLFTSKKHYLLVQNFDDRQFFIDHQVSTEKISVIRGSGVDIKNFSFKPKPSTTDGLVVTLVARMLSNKGIIELVNAARQLKPRYANVHFRLVGDVDKTSLLSLSEKQLKFWQEEGLIEWLGQQEDINSILQQTHIAVLPTSYGEGLPKALLEAAACGCPLIATDMPGCREIVNDGENGFLIPVGDSQALADKLTIIIEDSFLREKMGKNSRALVEKEFSSDFVGLQTIDLYQKLLEKHES